MIPGLTAGVLMGGARAVVTLSDANIGHIVAAPATATAGYQLELDGDIAANGDGTGGSFVDVGDWISPKGAAGAAYECRASIVSGTLSSGTTGSWLALSSTRTWTRTAASALNTCVFTLEIRLAASGVVLGTATITLTAESS